MITLVVGKISDQRYDEICELIAETPSIKKVFFMGPDNFLLRQDQRWQELLGLNLGKSRNSCTDIKDEQN